MYINISKDKNRVKKAVDRWCKQCNNPVKAMRAAKTCPVCGYKPLTSYERNTVQCAEIIV